MVMNPKLVVPSPEASLQETSRLKGGSNLHPLDSTADLDLPSCKHSPPLGGMGRGGEVEA